jgi:formamidopyrimidine-DNA glycosylase
MPELPEVETVRRGLQPVMEGARFTKVEAIFRPAKSC